MNPDLELVKALTESVLPFGLAVAASDPRVMPRLTYPGEAEAIGRAVPRRLTEFHAGRAAARAAMALLEIPPAPIPMGPDRAPIWPEGVTGSISHTATACVAAVGLSDQWKGIGVDLEEATALDPLLVAEICTRAEQRWLGDQPAAERGLMAKLIFSAKEATYKAQYALSGRLFGFDALELAIDRSTSCFKACFQCEQGPFAAGTILAGSYVHAAGLLVTGVALGQAEVVQLTGR